MTRLPMLVIAAAVLVAAAPLASRERAVDAPVDATFDIGGRAIRVACSGSGAPTVVVDAGMGTGAASDPGWQRIAAKVSPKTRICLHDRAGLGGSDPAPAGVRTSADAVADLHGALRAAGVQSPYLLVGHSIGGLHAQVFASRHPEDTAGLVLVSSTHPDQVATWLSLLPPAAAGEAQVLAEARAFLVAMADEPGRNEERLDFRASAAQARALETLGDRPLVVATHSPRFRMVPGLAEPLAITLEDATQAMQRRFLSLSTDARQVVSPTAGHGLPHEAPDFVVDAILVGVDAVRARDAAH